MMTKECKIDPVVFQYYPRLNKLKDYVLVHFTEPLDLQVAADIAGLEKTYFSKFFHEKVGICFREWLGQLRIQHAIQLMSRSDSSITQIAYSAGFQDLRTFERTFRKVTGMCPMTMKQQLRTHYLSNHNS